MVRESSVQTIDPRVLIRNPENPRLIFRSEELESLQDSIRTQGILVPLTVYADRSRTIILDGERRWRCALKLGLTSVPVVVQPKPDRLQNIMMMFAIHNARRDWDPLPTAYKLRDLERECEASKGRRPTEIELAELASLSRGEVRRLKKLLALPKEYRVELMQELEKPRHMQVITVDHVLETQKGAASLKKRGIVDDSEEDELRKALLAKFRSRILKNTVAPRQLARIGRAVEREELSRALARRTVLRLVSNPSYTIEDAFKDSAAQHDFQHTIGVTVERLVGQLEEHHGRGYELAEDLRKSLIRLRRALNSILGT